MAEANFPAIYRDWTPAEVKQQQETAEVNGFASELHTALSHGNFKEAKDVLTNAGTCKWDALFPGGSEAITGYDGPSKFVAEYSFDKNTTKLTVSEIMNAGGGSLFMGHGQAYVPRLSITGDNCQNK